MPKAVETKVVHWWDVSRSEVSALVRKYGNLTKASEAVGVKPSVIFGWQYRRGKNNGKIPRWWKPLVGGL